jgi:hypothetical protein
MSLHFYILEAMMDGSLTVSSGGLQVFPIASVQSACFFCFLMTLISFSSHTA